MLIDIIFLLCMILALIKGYRNGLIVAVFSFVAIVVGLTAAMKLSAYVAEKLGQQTSISQSWLPFISFAIVMIAVVILVRLGATALQKMVEMVFFRLAKQNRRNCFVCGYLYTGIKCSSVLCRTIAFI